MKIMFAALSSLWPSRAPVHIYTYVSCHKESLLHASLCFQTYLNIINIIIDNYKEHKKLLLHSITLTAKSNKKMKGDK